MSLLKLCQKITNNVSNILPSGHRLEHRLACPEYSKSAQEVKTYPLLNEERIFALCWNFSVPNTLHATLVPAPKAFCCRLKITENEMTQLHTHDYIELAYIIEGTFRQKILGKDISFHKGELCLIDKNCLHQDYLENQNAVILFLGIANDMFKEIMDENITTQKIIAFLQSALLEQKDLQQYLHFRPVDDNAVTETEFCLFSLLTELTEHKIGCDYICKGLLLRIFRTLSTQYEFSLSREQRNTMSWILFEEITEYIRENFPTVTVEKLVHKFHFQEDYFNRLIKSKTGMTYSAYLQQIRLEHAEKLLLTSNKSIEDIADSVGYHNKGYFYKIFVQKNGMTPAQYRKS